MPRYWFAFLYSNPNLRHFAWQLSLRLGYPVLHIDRCLVGICPLFEINVDAGRPRRGCRFHVSHVLHPVNRFFQGNNHRILHRFRTRTHIRGGNMHGRRGNIREFFNGQGLQSQQAQKHDADGYAYRKHRTAYKHILFHGATQFSETDALFTSMPSRSKPAPEAIISSPTCKPAVTTYSFPSFMAATEICVLFVFPSTTL